MVKVVVIVLRFVGVSLGCFSGSKVVLAVGYISDSRVTWFRLVVGPLVLVFLLPVAHQGYLYLLGILVSHDTADGFC